MGASSQIRDLLTSLPIDETWVLVGMAVLAVAAVSHLTTMWRDARYGMGGNSNNSRTQPASRYFEAWEAAATSEGLETEPADEPLDAPPMRGRWRELPIQVEMQLRRSGRRTPDPEAIHPATVHCQVTARAELPFPWRDATIREFILPESVQKGDHDEVRFGFDLPDDVRMRGVRIARRAREPLAEMAEQFKTVRVVDGVLTVADDVQPSRNTARWKERFGEWLRTFATSGRAFADGGLRIDVELLEPGVEIGLRFEPDPVVTRRRCRVEIEVAGDAVFTGEVLRDRLQRMGATVETLDTGDHGLRVEAVVARDDEDLVRRFVEALTP